MVLSYRINFQDLVIVRHAHVDELGNELPWRGLAHKEPDILECIGHPREQNEECDDDCADGVQIPDELVTHNGHDKTEEVDGNVVPVINLCVVSMMVCIV